ncbi:MAG: preprotein translocase subunit SecG [Candidatus Electryonea clarkiae]|nr:preprotein translocase subunit SecG [Candidatus Electryonea clarkiae]MDP8288548.1 preprotein translocase subunit SecG [Candidatus Electryonea clarkiae]
MIYGFLLFIHVLICILLVIAVLMQRAKGGGLAGIAGGAASQAVLGGRGAATVIHKFTVGLAISFGVVCLLLGILSKGKSTAHSVTQEAMQEEFPLNFLGESEEAASIPASDVPAGTDESGSATPIETEK